MQHQAHKKTHKILLPLFVVLLAGCSQSAGTAYQPQLNPSSPTSINSSTAAPRHSNAQGEVAGPPPTYTFEVINSWPHDPQAFTQGLVFHDGFIFESTGLNGSSSLRKVKLQTGHVLLKQDVPAQHFAEGMTIFQGKVFQLTWQSRLCFVYDLDSFNLIDQFSYDGEGWGLTHDQQSLIMSDGTHQLRFLDPRTFQVTRVLSTYSNNLPVMKLNELEYVNGEIYANIWQTDQVVRINPASGEILGWIDLTGLLTSAEQSGAVDVLNGLAYDQGNNRLFVTGKLWPKLFEIRLHRK